MEHLLPCTIVKNLLCPDGLLMKYGPSRDICVPFNQCRLCTNALHETLEEQPNRICHSPVMGVNQQRMAMFVFIWCVPPQMDLSHMVYWKRSEVLISRPPRVGCRHKHIVHIQQQTTSSAVYHAVQELRFLKRAVFKNYIG
ncbi:hypothetical protein AY586_16235 [Marichromatium gracile]|uniref:Uncharacterized protein n=1 Tax=Marichromatium gracile TaxID=1048 RepID=A0ABR5VH04_MARGR|nr:hypothetical protein AY586_16235 [Marichromatium gracile]